MRALNVLLETYDDAALLTLAFIAIAGSSVVGIVVDRVMQKRGFGAIGNAFLIMSGVFASLAISYDQLGSIRAEDSNRLILVASSCATLVLLVCGVLKSYLQEDV